MKLYHICAYPSIWEETACRQVLEAMSAGMVCVHPNFGALFDTTGGLNFMYDGTYDMQDHANMFYGQLASVIELTRNGGDELKSRLNFNKSYVDTRYNPALAEERWTKLLVSLINQYPDLQSRHLPRVRFQAPKKQEFIYRTT